MSEFRPIAEANNLPFGTIADLKMASGRTYSATWEFHGRCCAWWPHIGQVRRSPIGLYEPVAFRITGRETDPYIPEGLAQRPLPGVKQMQHSRARALS